MNILVVTTFNNKLESAYAHRFRETYNWPFQLKDYNEDTGMYAQIPELKEIVDRNEITKREVWSRNKAIEFIKNLIANPEMG